MHDQPLAIGVDDFEKLITKGYYYVDKTGFIKELLDKKGEVSLFTRPRRFGKTLNLSMLKYYFEDTGNEEQKKCRAVFRALDCRCRGKLCEKDGAVPSDYADFKIGKAEDI